MDLNQQCNQQLYVDYITNFNKVADLFLYDPYDNNSFKTRSINIKNHFSESHRNELASILWDYHVNLTSCQEVFNSIKALTNQDTLAVVTGQQPGVLTGPLYTIYKAVTAIKLAKDQAENLGVKIVPMFWMASEDHDINEVKSYTVMTEEGLQSLSIELPDFGASIGDLPLGEAADDLLIRLAELFKDSPYQDKWVDIFRDALRNADTLADWTANILLTLFQKDGLIIIDPMLPGVRRLSKEILLQGSVYPNGITPLLETSRLQELGYSPPLTLREHHTGIFYYLDRQRTPLIKDQGKFSDPEGEVYFSEEELQTEINQVPWNFSQNVALRPIVQDSILPTLAYVGGPGEISYFAQLQPVYQQFGVEMPIIYPREHFLLVDKEQQAILDNYQVTVADVLYNFNITSKKILTQYAPIDIEEVYQQKLKELQELHNKYIDELSEIDSRVKGLKEKNYDLIAFQLEYLKKKAYQYHKQNNIDVYRDLSQLREGLFPRETPQDRILNISQYLVDYDSEVINILLEIELNPYETRMVIL